jgi:hypothetical protein
VTITNCTLQNFLYSSGNSTTGDGILIQPTSGTVSISITNTTASNNGWAGIAYSPQSGTPNINAVIDNVITNSNVYGIYSYTYLANGGTADIAVSNSFASNNSNIGFYFENGVSSTTNASLDNVSASANPGAGIRADGSASVLLGRSVLVGNSHGVIDGTTAHTIYTYQDNRINLNTADGTGTLNKTSPQQ